MKQFILLSLVFAFTIISSCSTNSIETSDSMNGVEMTYQYSEGNSYHLKFINDSVSYQFLSGSAPQTWWGPFEYSYLQRDNGEYFLSWYEHGYGDYITLLIDNDKKSLIGSGIIIKKNEPIIHFQKAIISEFKD